MADKLEEAFSNATRLLFGKPLSPIAKYEKWLSQRVPRGRRVKSCFGTGEAYLPDYGFFRKMPQTKVASLEDEAKASQPLLKSAEGVSLSGIRQAVAAGAYFVPTYSQGNNIGVEDSFGYIDCLNVKHAFDPFTSKNCAYALSIMEAEGSFGLHRCKAPKFSIHLYNCWNVQRCFEMDSANNCSDSMFCHNVENLQNCLFCFNVKSKRHAIGNVEVGKEKYFEFRAKLCAEMVRQLEASGKVAFDIYDVLGRKG
ncbi:MAG: hypothetical protein NTX79_05410 [Candidatus Micrarchaeota archaeon]|nr:hypothetical protein [Candidatus Micrarchaeota archaeon]